MPQEAWAAPTLTTACISRTTASTTTSVDAPTISIGAFMKAREIGARPGEVATSRQELFV
jgi:hypothetical protein